MKIYQAIQKAERIMSSYFNQLRVKSIVNQINQCTSDDEEKLQQIKDYPFQLLKLSSKIIKIKILEYIKEVQSQICHNIIEESINSFIYLKKLKYLILKIFPNFPQAQRFSKDLQEVIELQQKRKEKFTQTKQSQTNQCILYILHNGLKQKPCLCCKFQDLSVKQLHTIKQQSNNFSISKKQFLDQQFLGTSRFLSLLQKIGCLLNNGGGYLLINQEQEDPVFSFPQNQLEKIQDKIQYIIKERVKPSKNVQYFINIVKVPVSKAKKNKYVEKNYKNQKKKDKNKYEQKYEQKNQKQVKQQEEENLTKKQIAVVNIYPIMGQNYLQCFPYAVKNRHLQTKDQYSVYISNQNDKTGLKQIVVLNGQDQYRLMHRFYQQYMRKKTQRFQYQSIIKKCRYNRCGQGSSLLKKMFQQPLRMHHYSEVIDDEKPKINYKFSYIIGYSSHAKDEAISETKKQFNKNMLRCQISTPFRRQTLNTMRQFHLLNSNAQFMVANQTLKKSDYLKNNHFLIVLSKYLEIDVRFPNYKITVQKLKNSVRNRFQQAYIWDIPDQPPNIFTVSLQFESELHCYYAFCLLQNQNVKSRFIKKSVFEEQYKAWIYIKNSKGKIK